MSNRVSEEDLSVNEMSFEVTTTPDKVKRASLIWMTSRTKLATYNLATRELNVIGDMGVRMGDIAMSPAGKLFGVRRYSTTLYRINKKTAKVTKINETESEDSITSISFASSGILYGASNGALITIDPLTAEVTVLGTFPEVPIANIVFWNTNLYFRSSSGDYWFIADPTDIGPISIIGSVEDTKALVSVYVKDGLKGAYHIYAVQDDTMRIYEIEPNTGKRTHKTLIPTFSDEEDAIDGMTSEQYLS